MYRVVRCYNCLFYLNLPVRMANEIDYMRKKRNRWKENLPFEVKERSGVELIVDSEIDGKRHCRNVCHTKILPIDQTEMPSAEAQDENIGSRPKRKIVKPTLSKQTNRISHRRDMISLLLLLLCQH